MQSEASKGGKDRVRPVVKLASSIPHLSGESPTHILKDDGPGSHVASSVINGNCTCGLRDTLPGMMALRYLA